MPMQLVSLFRWPIIVLEKVKVLYKLALMSPRKLLEAGWTEIQTIIETPATSFKFRVFIFHKLSNQTILSIMERWKTKGYMSYQKELE